MRQALVVGAGGFVGAMLRYAAGVYIVERTVGWRFPLHTVLVNVSGCLVAGVLAGMADNHRYFGADARLFLFAGLLGGFTTFSAFGLETVYLIQRQELGVAVLNVVVSVAFGALALWLGLRAVS